MDNNKLINRLEYIEATASILLKEAARLKKALQPVSTGANQKKQGLTEEQKARILARREKNVLRSNARLSGR